jgi:hypothetical protein
MKIFKKLLTRPKRSFWITHKSIKNQIENYITMATNTISISNIALPYKIWFLYLEPVFALGGTYLCLFDPDRFLSGTVPLPALSFAPILITPILQMMLTNIGALYILFAVVEGGILRLTREKTVWLAIIAAMLASDVGHIYAAYVIAPERILEVGGWNSDEWINYGTLIFGAALRVAFLLGIERP